MTLLWNGLGAYTIIMAQMGRLPGLSSEEVAYYAGQPVWFVVATDVAVLAPLMAAVALLLRSRAAAWLFLLSVIAIVVTNTYDLAAGSSRVLVSAPALVATVIIAVIASLQLTYAWTMKKRALLT